MHPYTVKIKATFEEAVALVTEALRQRGFEVVRSFDLATALDPEDPACSCPHHGTEQCTCRYTVLLVYPPAGGDGSSVAGPRGITIHVHDAEAYVGLTGLQPAAAAAGSGQHGQAILQCLAEASLAGSENASDANE